MTEEQTVEGGLAEPEELEPDQGSLDLAAPEDRHDRAEWEAAAAAVLRKARRLTDDDPDAQAWDKLTRTTLDGIGITPLGTPELLEALVTVGRPVRPGPWDIRAHLHCHGRQDGQRDAAHRPGGRRHVAVARGRRGHRLERPARPGAARPRVGRPQTTEAGARAFLRYADGRELNPRTNLGLDARHATRDLADQAWQMGVRVFVVDATEVHDRGASDVQELAHSLAVGAHYLRTLTDAGFDLDEAAKIVEFRYAATDEQFTTIAKLRAARRLWARVLELSGPASASSTSMP